MIAPLTFTHVGPTLTLNKAKGLHWSKISPVIAQWKEDFGWLGKTTRVQVDEVVGIEIYVTSRETGGIGDACAHAYLAKAAIDGLVVARVLREDSGAHVAWQRHHAPQRSQLVPAGCVSLTLELVPLTRCS